MDLLKTLTRYMGVNLGGRDVGMTQKQLYHSQISTMIKQVGCKGMS